MNEHQTTRALTFERWFNVRDLGNLPAPGGRTRAGRLFRASTPGALTADDVAQARALGLRTVIDLRSDNEIEPRPHSIAALGVDYRRANLQVTLEGLDAQAGIEVTPERYLLYLDTGGEAIRDLFSWLGDESTYPAVIHCVGGTHRTAVITALALDLVGVPRESIEVDYQMSGPEVQRVLAFWATRGWFSDTSTEQTDQLIGVHPGVVTGFLNAVDSRYGNTADYLLGIGVTPQAIEGLRHVLGGAS